MNRNEAYRGNRSAIPVQAVRRGKAVFIVSLLRVGAIEELDFLCLSTRSAQVIAFQVENSNGVCIPRKSTFLSPSIFSPFAKSEGAN